MLDQFKSWAEGLTGIHGRGDHVGRERSAGWGVEGATPRDSSNYFVDFRASNSLQNSEMLRPTPMQVQSSPQRSNHVTGRR